MSTTRPTPPPAGPRDDYLPLRWLVTVIATLAAAIWGLAAASNRGFLNPMSFTGVAFTVTLAAAVIFFAQRRNIALGLSIVIAVLIALSGVISNINVDVQGSAITLAIASAIVILAITVAIIGGMYTYKRFVKGL